MCVTESLCCTAEIGKTLQINCTSIKGACGSMLREGKAWVAGVNIFRGNVVYLKPFI